MNHAKEPPEQRKSAASRLSLRGRMTALAVLIALGVALGLVALPRVDEAAAAKRPATVPATRPERAPLDVEGFLALQARLAEERRQRVQGMLDRIWPNRAFVTIGVELDPRWTRSEERIQPEAPALVDEQRSQGADGRQERSYEPFSGERTVTMLAPEIRRVSAALVLDTEVARDPAQQQRIVDAVKKAIGPVRGQDADVEVLVESLEPRATRKPQPTPAASDSSPADFTAFGASIALAALGMAWYWLRHSRLQRDRQQSRTTTPEPTAEETKRLRRDAIEAAVSRDPVQAARLFERWMAEGQT
ncbi:MAG: hypothetical protein AB7I19_14655 [Planctomycetota bacterium]